MKYALMGLAFVFAGMSLTVSLHGLVPGYAFMFFMGSIISTALACANQ